MSKRSATTETEGHGDARGTSPRWPPPDRCRASATRRGCVALPRVGSRRASGESKPGGQLPAPVADAAGSRFPAPIGSERAPMPTHHSGRCHDLDRLPPARPDAREQHPEQPIDRTKASSFRGGPLQHVELMSERENFCRELEPRADRGPKRGQQGDEQRSHPEPRTVSASGPQPQRPQHVRNIQ
jgi:hypothetical protein